MSRKKFLHPFLILDAAAAMVIVGLPMAATAVRA